MIVSYRNKRTRTFSAGERVKAFAAFERKAELRLDQLDAATSLLDLDLPGSRLEALKGDRKGIWSIWVNGNWRITFGFAGGDATDANLEDYH